ncbi:13075_t:CDS:2 [Ambispora leptoticha]|uniref:13075_t:CDS:1 n=1 Tax=Ambispora leptoticha TaxID=144679 RepID=A0A9N8Z313_9GLOM|nr:13075_t:CDS:2 [Ambispora leptoticha]
MPELKKFYFPYSNTQTTLSLKDLSYYKNNHSVTVFDITYTLNPSHPTHTKFTTWHKPTYF